MIKDNDFIEIDFTGKLKEDGFIFDTTRKDVAEKQGLNPKAQYKPLKMCVGEGMVLKGMEQAIVGKKVGEEFTIELEPENAFGKKSAKLLRMIPARVFKKQQIVPQNGLQVEIDGQMGIIKTAAGGRVIVDFNNPLAGKQVTYDIKVNKELKDTKEKIMTLVGPVFGEPKMDIKADKVEIELPFEMPKEIGENYSKKIINLVSEIKTVEFTQPKKDENKKTGSASTKEAGKEEVKKSENKTAKSSSAKDKTSPAKSVPTKK